MQNPAFLTRLAVFVIALTVAYTWLGVLWLGARHWSGGALILLNLALAAACHIRQGCGLAGWGLSWPDLWPGTRLALAATLPVVGVLFLAGTWIGRMPGREHPLADLAGLFLWGLAQQFVLQTVVLAAFRRSCGRLQAVTGASLVFALLHLPNPLLVPLTFAAGWLWCWIYTRHPNLAPLALSHALSSLTILATIPRDVTGAMRVGYSYLLWYGC